MTWQSDTGAALAVWAGAQLDRVPLSAGAFHPGQEGGELARVHGRRARRNREGSRDGVRVVVVLGGERSNIPQVFVCSHESA